MWERFLFGSLHIYDTRKDNGLTLIIGKKAGSDQHAGRPIYTCQVCQVSLRITKKPSFEFLRLCDPL